MMTIEQFCDRHNACPDGREWAKGYTSLQDVWDCGDDVEYVLWGATRPGVFDDRTIRLFTCWCVRQVWHLLTDERLRHAVEVAERYAVGEATEEELEAASAAALASSWAARSALASSWADRAAGAATAAAKAALAACTATAATTAKAARAEMAGWAALAAATAAWAAAAAATAETAEWSASDAAWAASDAVSAAQLTWLRENATPSFEAVV